MEMSRTEAMLWAASSRNMISFGFYCRTSLERFSKGRVLIKSD